MPTIPEFRRKRKGYMGLKSDLGYKTIRNNKIHPKLEGSILMKVSIKSHTHIFRKDSLCS